MQTDEKRRRFFYYLPGDGEMNEERLRGAGLADVFDVDPAGKAPPFEKARLNRGPDGGPGWLVAREQLGGLVYRPDKGNQSWCLAPGGACWIGWDPASPPRPQDLVRSGADGLPAELGDGNTWMLPAAELMPLIRTLQPDGSMGLERRAADAAVWELCEELRERTWEPINDALMTGFQAARRLNELREAQPPAAVEIVQEAAAALDAAWKQRMAALEAIEPADTARILAVNYHVGLGEVLALGLLRVDPKSAESTDWVILDAFCDGDGIRRSRAKKKDA